MRDNKYPHKWIGPRQKLVEKKREQCKTFHDIGKCHLMVRFKDSGGCKHLHGDREPIEKDGLCPYGTRCRNPEKCWYAHPSASKAIKRQACGFFSKHGYCGRGGKCHFTHDSRASEDKDMIRPRSICKCFRDKRWCKHGSNCRHLHSAKDGSNASEPKEEDKTHGIRAKCRYGSKCNNRDCKRTHQQDED